MEKSKDWLAQNQDINGWIDTEVICECDIKHIMVIPIKTMMFVLKTYIFTSITALSYWSRCDISNNVGLNLKNCCYYFTST